MIDNFKFIREEHYNCLENVLVSLMETWQQEYVLMFSEGWGFTYLPPEDKPSEILGNRIGGGEYKVWECLQKYYGIIPTVHLEEDTDLQKNILRNELAEESPVILSLDAFYAPWKDVFGKYHFEHYSLAIAIDEEKGAVYCLDPFVNSLANPLPMDNFIKGNAKCITLVRNTKNLISINLHEILKNAALTILRDEGDINGIKGMRAFADQMESSFNLRKEIEGFETMIWVSPIILRISDIGARRLHFASVLLYLEKHFSGNNLSYFSKQVEKAGWGWRRIRRLLASACDSENPEEFTVQIVSDIRRLAEFEESIAKEMLDHFNRY